MATLNPDFRSADEVVKPEGVLFGYSDGKLTESECVTSEARALDKLANDMPVAFSSPRQVTILPRQWEKFNAYQKSKGRAEGSCDWSLLDEYVTGSPLLWLPQIIGSCVTSNSMRPWVTRLMYQIAMLGNPMEYLGRSQVGFQNYCFFSPWSYGMARRRANMRGGDGLWCGPQLESYIKDGVLSCSTPALIDLMKSLGFAAEQHFPEPQGSNGARLYREFGDWKYLDQLKQYADFRLLEGGIVKTLDDQIARHKNGETTFVCSMLAIKKIGEHKDGFAIHGEDTRDGWPHNMYFDGFFFASDGELFMRMGNESWGERHRYNIRASEVGRWHTGNRVTMASIGQIDGPASTLIAA
jgi:hypothetical protein